MATLKSLTLPVKSLWCVCWTGDLGQVQAQAAGTGMGAAGLAALPAPRRPSVDRAHLEANMAAALVLRSPREYRRWLLLYVRHLAGKGHAAPCMPSSTMLLRHSVTVTLVAAKAAA
jgi:hypothetical protein